MSAEKISLSSALISAKERSFSKTYFSFETLSIFISEESFSSYSEIRSFKSETLSLLTFVSLPLHPFARTRFTLPKISFLDLIIQIPVNFIKADRLYINSNESRRIGVRNRYSSSHDSDREGDLKIEAITECAWDLRDRINNNKRTKEEVSEALDRTFPQRVIDLYKNTQKRDAKQIREQLQELEQKRKDLEKIGLIVDDRETLRFSSDEDFPTDALPVLEIYIEDNKKKLAAYDKLKVQIDLLLKAINESNAFANKKLVIQTNKSHSINPYAALKAAPKALKFLTNDGREIPLERLSSGEKHAVILFYNLIFNSKEDSLVMIDEPEISLHISWQQHFISSLLEICKENRLYAVIATHSPDIVNGHWDLLVNLDGTPVDEDDEED